LRSIGENTHARACGIIECVGGDWDFFV